MRGRSVCGAVQHNAVLCTTVRYVRCACEQLTLFGAMLVVPLPELKWPGTHTATASQTYI